MATSQEWSCTNKIQITKVDGVKLMAAETPKQVHDKDGNAISKVVTKGGDLVYAKDHAYGDYEYKNSSTHACTCANCGNELTASHTTNSYQSTGSSYHLAYCDTCGHTWGSNISHSWSYSPNYSSGLSSYHLAYCDTCGYTLGSNISHSWSYSPNYSSGLIAFSSMYHTKKCSVCGYSTTEQCSPVWDQDYDQSICPYCDGWTYE